MTGIPFIDIFIAISAAAGGVVVIWKFLGVLKKLSNVMDDWNGEPEREGVPGRPGVMKRLASIEDRQTTIEAELHPNHGSSLRDAVDTVVVTVQRLEERFDAHLNSGDS
ncbi:hypothetical protein [Microbispora bryophytorum]|uniref:hypothetical protein n=1 Tax=Microbispora bryophytorum TaxID=1460882 RepID=UPI0033CB9C44